MLITDGTLRGHEFSLAIIYTEKSEFCCSRFTTIFAIRYPDIYLSTRGQTMAEEPRDALVSRNSATTKHSI